MKREFETDFIKKNQKKNYKRLQLHITIRSNLQIAGILVSWFSGNLKVIASRMKVVINNIYRISF